MNNKDLNIFANKNLASIDVVFENLEVYNIPASGIYKLSTGDINFSFDIHINGLSKYTKPGEISSFAHTNFIWLALNKEGMNTHSGWEDMFEDSKLFSERIKYNDITHLDFIFDDGSNLYISVPWEDGNTEYENKLQNNDIRDGMLFISIDENKEISDEIIKEINDNQEQFHNWDKENSKDDNIQWSSIPNYVQAAFRAIDEELNRVMWNINQEEFESPFDNTSNNFKNDVFEVEAYSWDDEYEQKYNFKWGDYKVRWYKHSRRDPVANRHISPEECSKMLDECLESIKKMDKDDDLFEQVSDSYDCHFCCQCGEEATKELKNGKYACDNCLNKLGEEQKQLKEEIENSLFEFGFDNYEDVTNCIDTFIDFLKFAQNNSTITQLEHLINALGAINIVLKQENGLLDEETTKKLKEIIKNW